MIDGQLLLNLLVIVVIGGLIFWLLWWFIGFARLPEPFNTVARVVIAFVALIILINMLLRLSGVQLIRW
jgi:hypothetical protein